MTPVKMVGGKIIMKRVSTKTWLLAAAATSAVLWPNAALAQVRTFNVPSESAVKGIPEFARQAEIQIVASADQLRGIRTSAVNGSMDLHAGLNQLLAGTGIVVASNNDQTVILKAPSKDEPASSDDDVETVYVIGQRAMVANSLARQRASDTIESVVTRDAIGQFPDQNVAEAARRLSGVTILPDQGEGRYITVRGLGSDFNSASVNGTRLPAPESDVRGVALDVIPTELVESIEVVKTLTSDMDADTIGASIQINTTKGFDRKDPFLSITAESSYSDLNGKQAPRGAVDFAYPVSDRFGIAGGFSYQRRPQATDNMEMSKWATSTRASSLGVVYAGSVNYRDYDLVRTRMGGSLSLDGKVGESTTLYLRGIYSVFEDQEQRRGITFNSLAAPSSGDANHATFLSGDGKVTIRRDLKDRWEGQIVQSYQAGGTTLINDWKFDYQASFSRSSEHERSQNPTRFQASYSGTGTLGVTFDYANLDTTTFNVITGDAAFRDPTKYAFTELDTVNGLGRDKELAYRGDVTRTFGVGGGQFEIKAGGKARLREKIYSLEQETYTGITGTTYTLANVAGTQNYSLQDINPLMDRSLVRAFNNSHLANFVIDPVKTAANANSSYFDIHENLYAGYLMGRYTAGPLMIVGGARIEATSDKSTGNELETVVKGGKHNGVVVTADTTFVTPIHLKKTYTDVEPSLLVRYEAADNMFLRGGVYRSVVRPNFADMAPHFSISESTTGQRTGSFGNPELNPYRAWNFDVSGEWYFAKDGVVQVGLFYKKISDFIVQADFMAADAPFHGVFGGVSFDEASIPMNADSATAKGLELNYQQALTMLPGHLDGLLVGFNYTYTDASGGILGRTIPLPSSTKHTFNAMLGYEKDRWSIRAGVNYGSGYLDELGGDPGTDRYVKSSLHPDLSIKYKVLENLRLYADFVNLNNQAYVAYQKGPGRDRLLQFETYSWVGKFGVKVNI